MFDAPTQARFSKSCSDAAFGYANAAGAAYAAMTKQTFDFWNDAMRTMAPPPKPEEPKSWYRHPDAPKPVPAAAHPFALMWWVPTAASDRPARAPSLMPTAVSPFEAMMAPWTTWMSMWASPRAPTAWPMAFMMVQAGVPRDVAVPTAEANAAALEAAAIAGEQISRVYSSFRSESGYASAQVVMPRSAPPPTPGRLSAPMPMRTTMWPWLH